MAMIKLLILDQEGTLYQNKKLLFKIKANTRAFFCKKLNIPETDYDNWYFKNKKEFPNILEALRKFKIPLREYHAEVFNTLNPENYLKKDSSLFKDLKKLRIPIYVVTSSSKEYSKRVLQSLGIDKLIKKSISLSDGQNNKIDIYKEIIKIENIGSKEVCVVGDNWDTDLKDAKKQGFKTILLGEKDEMPFFIKSVRGLLSAVNQFNYPKISFFDWKKVDKIIFKLENELKFSKFNPDLLVGVARGGLVPAKLINDRFSDTDFRIIYSRRYCVGFSSENPNIEAEMLGNIKSKKILLIDDVEDSGITIQKIKEKLLDAGAMEVKSLVVYSRAKISHADFVGAKGSNFAIFPWNKFEELKEFLYTELLSYSEKEKVKALRKMDFSKKDIFSGFKS